MIALINIKGQSALYCLYVEIWHRKRANLLTGQEYDWMKKKICDKCKDEEINLEFGEFFRKVLVIL